MDESLKAFAKQLGKNAEKQPGWAYLLIAIYLALYAFGVPSQFWNLTIPKLSAEVWAISLALLLYLVGDALDKITFKKRTAEGKWVYRFESTASKDTKKEAQDKLEVKDGVYDVSMKILEEAEEAKFSVHFLNEAAKFFRSLIIPGLAIAIVLSLELSLPWPIFTIALALLGTYLLAFQVYPRFKNLHIMNLYKWIHDLPKEKFDKITKADLGTARMFFWEGILVASAPKPEPEREAINLSSDIDVRQTVIGATAGIS